jgi:hypothetical protein
MKNFRILLYVTPKFKWKYKVNWLISLWTRSKYSHSEAWEATPKGDFALEHMDYPNPYGITETYYVGTCYTATMRGDDNGTVKRDASEVLDHPKHWVYFEIEVNETAHAAAMAYAEYEVKNNRGYGRWDLLKFFSPWHFPDSKRNICSEFCNNFLYYAGIFKKKGIISPGKLDKMLIELGYESKELK